MRKHQRKKLQSAMEYLMTYGWAILIIAVVLGVLFQLGVFSSSSFAIRAPPGGCQVFRPNGPGTAQNINLIGVCAGQLPKYVLASSGAGGITVQDSQFLNPTQAITISVWINLQAQAGAGQWPYILQKGGNAQYQVYFNPSGSTPTWSLVTSPTYQHWCIASPSNANVPLNEWHNYAFTYNAATGNAYAYYDGASIGGWSWGANAITTTTSPITIAGLGSPVGRQVANVQIYNASLASDDVKALYQKGIGGVPAFPQYIIGWWPFNGDAKDYSGNNNNGVSASISYTDQWISGYAIH
jgi:hypothetical protein